MEKSTDRDNFMSAEEAKNFGLIDNIIQKGMQDGKSKINLLILW